MRYLRVAEGSDFVSELNWLLIKETTKLEYHRENLKLTQEELERRVKSAQKIHNHIKKIEDSRDYLSALQIEEQKEKFKDTLKFLALEEIEAIKRNENFMSPEK